MDSPVPMSTVRVGIHAAPETGATGRLRLGQEGKAFPGGEGGAQATQGAAVFKGAAQEEGAVG